MPKYAVSLGAIHEPVMLEAANAQQALDNVISCMSSQSIAMIPREDKKESHWYSRNTAEAADEVLVKSTEQARKMLSKVRNDVVDIFWFVSMHEHSSGNKKMKKIRNR